jgi:hypothetical protein
MYILRVSHILPLRHEATMVRKEENKIYQPENMTPDIKL